MVVWEGRDSLLSLPAAILRRVKEISEKIRKGTTSEVVKHNGAVCLVWIDLCSLL